MVSRELVPGRSQVTAAAEKGPPGQHPRGVGKHSLPGLGENIVPPKVVDYAAFLADKDDEGSQIVLAFAKATTTEAAINFFTKHGDRKFKINLKNLIDVDGKEGLPLPSKKKWRDQIGEHKIGLEANGEFIPAEHRLKITMFLRVVPPSLPSGLPQFIPLQLIKIEINAIREKGDRDEWNIQPHKRNNVLQASAETVNGTPA